ncbi:hypothetical protein FACS1894219_12880 [Clostridia bacterium]|nr:hypothetical protein FACS1894219_12880 [Clostridia bacterium]
MAEGFGAQVPRFAVIGQNIVEGVWSGISGMSGWLSQSVSGMFSGLLAGVKGMLGINSPSRVFRDQIGVNMALGVLEGFSAGFGDVEKGIKGNLYGLASSALPDSSGSGAVGMVGSVNYAPSGAAAAPHINIVIEQTGSTRDVFEALSLGVKRVDYLNGGGSN